MFSPEGLSISDGKVTEMGVLPVFWLGCALQMVYSDCQGFFSIWFKILLLQS